MKRIETIERSLITLAILSGLIVGFALVYSNYGVPTESLIKEKPISLPEEIQAVQPNDTLIVSKVSDSIYIEFK